MDSSGRQQRNRLERLQGDATGLERTLAVLEEKLTQARRSALAAEADWAAMKARLSHLRGEIRAGQERIAALAPSGSARPAAATAPAARAGLLSGLVALGAALLMGSPFVPWFPTDKTPEAVLGYLLWGTVAAVLFGAGVVVAVSHAASPRQRLRPNGESAPPRSGLNAAAATARVMTRDSRRQVRRRDIKGQ